MASTVYTIEHVTLQDDSEAVLRPLPLAKLRRFMDTWEQFENLEDEKDSVNIMRDCAGIGLEKQFKGEVLATVEKKDGETEKAFAKRQEEAWTEWLEEQLDTPTMHKILEVCGGLRLNDPNLAAAMEELAKNQTQDGQG